MRRHDGDVDAPADQQLGHADPGPCPIGDNRTVALAALMLPAAVMALWLHLAAGEPGANCYGPAPAHDSGALQPA